MRDHYESGKVSDGLKMVCPKIDQFKVCISDMVKLIANITVEEHEHFTEIGFRPWLRVMEHVCEGNGQKVKGNLKNYIFEISNK